MGDADAEEAVLLIHGFGANTNHWRFNQPVLAERAPTYAIDLLGFGRSDQPRARLRDEPLTADAVHYGFDLWGQQVADFSIPLNLIWGEKDPWEPLAEVECWKHNIGCIRSLTLIKEAEYCPHDEAPAMMDPLIPAKIKHLPKPEHAKCSVALDQPQLKAGRGEHFQQISPCV